MRRLRPNHRVSPSNATCTRRLAGAGLVALALLVPTACGGSALDPAYVQSANNALLGQGNGTGVGAPVTGADGTSGDVPGAGIDPLTGTSTTGTGDTPGGGSTSTGRPANSGGGTTTVPGVKPGSCNGFKNQRGITDTTITVGNSSDISGPIPGLFTAAQQGAKAYVAYFNATSSICGRKLELKSYDSRTDAGADQQSYIKACDEVFAMVGSMSGFDSGGAQAAESCGLPDIRTAAVTAARNNCSTCFGAQSTGAYEFPNAVGDFFTKNYHDATQKSAMLYLNAGAAAENAQTQQEVLTRRGMKFIYTQAVDVADFNYGPYVQQMKSKGVRWVQFIGAYQQTVRLANAFRSSGYRPEVFYADPSVYDDAYVKSGGSAVNGTITFSNFTPFEESQPELNLYKQWLQQISPGAVPTFFGMFAWSAAKLFTEESIKLGAGLSRASLVAKMRTVNNWTADGLHAPMPVGSKHVSDCARFLQLDGSTWRPLKGSKYICNGLTKVK